MFGKRRFKTTATCLLLAVMCTATASAQQGGRDRVVGNVYAMDNNPEGNRVNIFDRFASGALRRAGSVRTGGLGAGDNASADPLGGQGSMLLSEDKRTLYVVNAGSDSITVFGITRSGRLLPIQRLPSNGLFPVSLASDGELVYVLNAGGDGAIAGYRVRSTGRLTPIDGSVRALDLGEVGIPVGDARNLAPGDIAFDTLNRRLVIAHAGGGADGELLSFPINDDDTPAADPVVVDSEGAVPFSLDFTDQGTALIAEASGSVSSYNFIGDADLETVSSAVANAQAATCWVQVAGNGFAYTTNTTSGTLSSYSVSRNGELVLADAEAADGVGEPTDFVVTDDARFLYVVASSEGGVRGYRVTRTGGLRDIGLFRGLPTFEDDGFAPQGIVVR